MFWELGIRRYENVEVDFLVLFRGVGEVIFKDMLFDVGFEGWLEIC